DGGTSDARAQQAHEQTDGRRLAGAVGAEEADHLARLDLERERVDGERVAKTLGEPGRLDHGATAATTARSTAPRRRSSATRRGSLRSSPQSARRARSVSAATSAP